MTRYFLSSLFILIYSNNLQAQLNDTLHAVSEVTIVGNKSISLPGSGQYLSSKILHKLNQPNINQVLRQVPGVSIRDEEGFGLRPNIGLRGTAVNRSAKITLMEDGILAAPAPYADPSAYYFPTFARMQGLEVLKGSSQITCGPYTIGGALNLLSTAIPNRFKAFAQISYGSFNTNQQRIWVGDQHKNFDYVFELNRLGSSGFKTIDGGGPSGFDRRDMMTKLRWHTAAHQRLAQSLTLKYLFTKELAHETYLGLTYADYLQTPNRRYAATQKDLLDLNHQLLSLTHVLNPGNGITLTTSVYTTQTFRAWGRANSAGGQSLNTILSDPSTNSAAYRILSGQQDGELEYQRAARSYQTKGIQTNLNYVLQKSNWRNELNLGIRYHQDLADRWNTKSEYQMSKGTMILSNEGVQGNLENQVRQAESLAAYLQYSIQYKRLRLTPGIRFEHIQLRYKNYGTSDQGRIGHLLQTASNPLQVFAPGLGLQFSLHHDMNIFAGVHKGYSPPGMPSPNSTTGQAKPESAINYELGYRYSHSTTQMHVVAFLNQYDNILGSDNVSGGGAGSGNTYNAGNASIYGIELMAEYNLCQAIYPNGNRRLPVQVVYTYTKAVFNETFKNAGGDWGSGLIQKNDNIPFITPHVFCVNLGWETKRWNTILSTRYVGATWVKPGQGDAVYPEVTINYNDVNSMRSYLLMDVSGNYQLSQHLTVFMTLNNLLNNKRPVSNLPQGFRPSLPRQAIVGIKILL